MKHHSHVNSITTVRLGVWCADSRDGVFTVAIRTLTYEELERVLHTPRRAPKLAH